MSARYAPNTPSFSTGVAGISGHAMASMDYIVSGHNPDGTPIMQQKLEIPESALNNWTPDQIAANCLVEETFSNDYIRVFSIKTCYQDKKGAMSEPAPLMTKTGPVRIFDLKKVNLEGKPMSMFTLGIRVLDGGESFLNFSDSVDAFIIDFVRKHNPQSPKGNSYFKQHPATLTDDMWSFVSGEKIKQNFWTDPAKTRPDGTPWDRIGNVSIWPNSVEHVLTDETGQNWLPENEAFVKGNTCVFAVKLDGIILGQTTIKARWTVINGVVTERSSGGGYGYTGEYMASTFGNYVSSAPKIQTMPAPGQGNNTFGGVDFGDTY